MFAGSCIGVLLLVMTLEFLRRLGKEYDRYILRQHQRTYATTSTPQLPVQGNGKDASTHSSTEHGRSGVVP